MRPRLEDIGTGADTQRDGGRAATEEEEHGWWWMGRTGEEKANAILLLLLLFLLFIIIKWKLLSTFFMTFVVCNTEQNTNRFNRRVVVVVGLAWETMMVTVVKHGGRHRGWEH